MHTYLMLARGENLSSAEVLAVSANQRLIGRFIGELLGNPDRDLEPENAEPSEAQGEDRERRLEVVSDPE